MHNRKSAHLSQSSVDLQQQSLRVQLLCRVSILKCKTVLSGHCPGRLVADMQGQQNLHLGAMVADFDAPPAALPA